MPPTGEPAHCFVMISVFIKTDGEIGGVGVFHQVRILPIVSEQNLDDQQS